MHSLEREHAKPTYPAELQTVGSHTSLTVSVTGDWIAKPQYATHVQLQTINKNIRYTIDNSPATVTHGFQLTAGSITLVPVPNNGVSIFPESVGAILQYQWVR